MGKRDIQEMNYLEDDRRFADLINGSIFQGRQVVKAADLQEANKELLFPWSKKGNRVVRDVVKKFYRDMLICILTVENQTNIDYHMVLRTFLGDALEYHRQWSENAREHRRKGDLRGDEFLSGMKKGERFHPVLTVIVYYGAAKWDAPTSLHELLDFGGYEKEIKALIPDYRIHVFDYHDYDSFDVFETELKQVFSFLKCAQDKAQLKKLLAEHREEYYNVDKETGAFIAAITNSKKLMEFERTETGGIDMCKALDDIWLEGKEEGWEEGREEGKEEGELSKLISLIMKKYHKGKSIETIADEVEESIETVRPIFELVKDNPCETEQGILKLIKPA